MQLHQGLTRCYLEEKNSPYSIQGVGNVLPASLEDMEEVVDILINLPKNFRYQVISKVGVIVDSSKDEQVSIPETAPFVCW